MRALFDVNALLAVFDERHTFNRRIRSWWHEHRQHGWATCPQTQNGFARVLSQPGYPNRRALQEALHVLESGISQSGHEFWPDDISLADPAIFDRSRMLGPRQITDVYLLALAVKNGGRLITFDRGLPIGAVRGATLEHVVSL